MQAVDLVSKEFEEPSPVEDSMAELTGAIAKLIEVTGELGEIMTKIQSQSVNDDPVTEPSQTVDPDPNEND